MDEPETQRCGAGPGPDGVVAVEDCVCEFDPYEYDDPAEDDGEESWHYKRTCGACGEVWWSLHCPHDGVQNPCPACGWRPLSSRTPMEFLGFARPPGA